MTAGKIEKKEDVSEKIEQATSAAHEQHDNKALLEEIKKGAKEGDAIAIITPKDGKEKIEYLNVEEATKRDEEYAKNGIPKGTHMAVLDGHKQLKGGVLDVNEEAAKLKAQAEAQAKTTGKAGAPAVGGGVAGSQTAEAEDLDDPKKMMKKFVQSAMSSGDIGQMLIAMVAMKFFGGFDDQQSPQQNPQVSQGQDQPHTINLPGGTNATATTPQQPELQVTGHNAAPGAEETIVTNGKLSPRDIAAKMGQGDNEDFMKAIVEAQQKAGTNLSFKMDVDHFEAKVPSASPQMAQNTAKLEVR